MLNTLKHAFTSGVRGSTSMSIIGKPTFAQKGDDKVTVKGLSLEYTWSEAEFLESGNPIADDLKNQAKKDLEDEIAGQTMNHILENFSQSSVIVEDQSTYPEWRWGPFGTCDDATCTHTRKKICINQSQLPCAEDPDDSSTETQTCTSDTCREYTGLVMTRYVSYHMSHVI